MYKKVTLSIIAILFIITVNNANVIWAASNYDVLVIYDEYTEVEAKEIFEKIGYENEYVNISNMDQKKFNDSKYIIYLTKKEITEEFIGALNVDKKIYLISTNKNNEVFYMNSITYKNSTYKNEEIKNIKRLDIKDALNIATIGDSKKEIPYIIKKDKLYIQPNLNMDNIIETLITKDFMYDFLELNVANNREYIMFKNESNLSNEELMDKFFDNKSLNNLDGSIIQLNIEDTSKIREYSILRNGVLFINVDKTIKEEKLRVLENYIASMGFYKGNFNKDIEGIDLEKDDNIYIIKDDIVRKEIQGFEKIAVYFTMIIFILLIIFTLILRNNNNQHKKKLFKE